MQPLLSKKNIAILSILIILSLGTYIKLHEKVTVLEVVKIEEKINWPIKTTLGISVENRNIENYTFGDGETHLVFVGGIHGGYEWNSILLAYKLIDYLTENIESIPKNITIDILPSANPDGLYKVTGKEGRFTIEDVSINKKVLASGRFNANGVDLNRNFDCKWKPKSTWQSKTVSAGTAPFSEPETAAIQNFIIRRKPSAVIFWHSQSNGVFASQCQNGILPETLTVMNLYSQASGYPAIKTFDAYETTGAVDDWLSSVNIPAITVELKSHETIEWEKNLAGIQAILTYYKK